MEAEAAGTVLFGHTVSDLQTNIAIANGAITGTLKFVDTGSLPTTWGEGNFLALKFTNNDTKVTSIKVGMEPSVSSGLVELDEDMNAVMKVTNKNTQKFVVEAISGATTQRYVYDLSGLTCQTE